MSAVYPPNVPSVLAEHRRRIRALEAVPASNPKAILASAVCAEWLNDGSVVSVDTYSGGSPLVIPVWDYNIHGPDMVATGDGFSVTCGPGVYIAKANWWFDFDFDPTTMFFDLRLDPGAIGAGIFGYFGSTHGVAQGFNNPTFVTPYGPVTSGVAPLMYVAQTEQWFIVPTGSTVDISTVVLTNTNGLKYVHNLVAATNPGASNLTIVRVGN